MTEKLNPRWDKFAERYAFHGIGTKAAIEAGYVERSAHVTASRLLKNDKVLERVRHYHEQRHMGPEEVMAGLADIARLSMGDFARVQKNGGAALDLVKAKRASKLNMIRELQTDTETHTNDDGDETVRVTKTKVKLYDRQRALETIAKHHGLLKDAEINININIHLELITRTWSALENAGLDPVKTFESLIQLAHENNAD